MGKILKAVLETAEDLFELNLIKVPAQGSRQRRR
jgi:hypothetical protein